MWVQLKFEVYAQTLLLPVKSLVPRLHVYWSHSQATPIYNWVVIVVYTHHMHALQVDVRFNTGDISLRGRETSLTYPPFPSFWGVFILAYLFLKT